MFKKLLSVTIAGTLCFSLLAGCGPKKVGPTNSSSSKSSSSSMSSGGSQISSLTSGLSSTVSGSKVSTISKAISKITATSGTKSSPVANKNITISGSGDSLLAAVSDYEDTHSNVKFKVTPPSGTVAADVQLKLDITAGTEPDILMLDHVYITSLGVGKQLLDLVPLGANNIKGKYIPTVWNAVSFNNQVYGLPHDGNTLALMYNKTRLSATGLAAPSTYEQLVSVGQKMMANDPGMAEAFTTPFVQTSDDGRLNWSSMVYFTWLWRCGGEILSSDNKTAKFNGPGGVKALQMLLDLVKQSKISDGVTYKESQFYNGDVGMIELGNWSIAQLTNNPKASLGVAPLPTLVAGVPNYSGLGLFAMGITASCPYPDVAFDFLSKYTTSDEYQLQYCKANNQLPVTESALKDPYYTTGANAANWKVFIDQYKNSKARPGVACWTQLQKEVANAIAGAIAGGQPQAVLDAAAAKVNLLLK
jgi:multiple sugar transport system substrate-binding protein